MNKYLLPLAFLSTIGLFQVDESKAQSSRELRNIISSQQTINKNNKQYEIESTVSKFIEDVDKQFNDQEPEKIDSITGSKLILEEDDFLERLRVVMDNFVSVSQNKNDGPDHEKSLMSVSGYVSGKKIGIRAQMIGRKQGSGDSFLYVRNNKDMRGSTIFLQYDGKMVAVQLSDEHPVGGPVNNINLYAIKDSSDFNFSKITRPTTQQDRFANLHTRKTEQTKIKKSKQFSYQELLEVFNNALNSYSTAK